MDRSRLTRAAGGTLVAAFLIASAVIGADALTRPAGPSSPVLVNESTAEPTDEATETPEATETAEPTDAPEATETADPTDKPEKTDKPAKTKPKAPEAPETTDDESGDHDGDHEHKNGSDKETPDPADKGGGEGGDAAPAQG